jgi:hypothetical protein
MRGNLERCPKCGLMARTPEGTYNVRDGLVEVVDAPQWTRDAFTQASRALEDLALGKERTQATAIRELHKTTRWRPSS